MSGSSALIPVPHLPCRAVRLLGSAVGRSAARCRPDATPANAIQSALAADRCPGGAKNVFGKSCGAHIGALSKLKGTDSHAHAHALE